MELPRRWPCRHGHGSAAVVLASSLASSFAFSAALGPSCNDPSNECRVLGQGCASLRLSGGGGDLVRTWCLGEFADSPGNTFDTNGAWGDQEFTSMSFFVEPAESAITSYVSLFSADYCSGRPVYIDGGDGDAGAYLPGDYSFGPTVVKCIHPYYWADRANKPGVGIKLVLWPDNDFLPYDQVTCLADDWVDAGVDWFGQKCASGVDGIYCIEPDEMGPNDGFLQRLDFAGSTSSQGNDVVQSYQDWGSYPVGSVAIQAFYSVAGEHGYCEQTMPYKQASPGFCDPGSPYSAYCVWTRFSDVADNGDWDTYDAQAVADHQSVCSEQGAMWANLKGLTRPDGSAYSDWPLPIKYAWTRIMPCGMGRRLGQPVRNASRGVPY